MPQGLPDSFEPLEDSKDSGLPSSFQAISEAAQKPLATTTPQLSEAMKSYQAENPITGGIGNFGMDVLSSMTSPLSLGLMATGAGETLAAKAGLEKVASLMRIPSKIAANAMVLHGGSKVIGSDETMPERLGGGLEAGLGILGLRSGVRKINPKIEPIEAESPSLSPNIKPATDVELPPSSPDLARIIGKGNKLISLKPGVAESAPFTPEEISNAFKSKESNYVTSIKGMTKEEARFNKFLTGAVDFPEEVFTELSTLAKKYRSYPTGSPEAAKIGREMIEIRDFMEGEKGPSFNRGVELIKKKVNNTITTNELQELKTITQKPELPPSEKVSIQVPKETSTEAAPQGARESTLYDVVSVPKSIMASTDVSAPLRQGLPLISRPEYWNAFPDMFKSLGSEKAYQVLINQIKSKPTYQLGQKAGLYLSGPAGTKLADREEAFMSNLAEKIPGVGGVVRASDRAYTGFLDKLRSDTFESLINDAKSSGLNPETNEALQREIANFVNVSTGRGSLGSLEKNAVGLNALLFSPRMISSRLTMLTPSYYVDASPFVRKQALKALFSVAGAGMTVAGLAKAAGAEVSLNPTSTDFGKIKIGDTRVDPYGGFQQYIVAAQRLMSNQTTNISGKTSELGKGYRASTGADVLLNLAKGKLSPVASFANDLLTGKDYSGKPIKMSNEVISRFTPLLTQDIYDLAKEDPRLLPLAIPAALGMGVQSYGK